MPRSRRLRLALVLLVPALALACNERPARDALDEADQAIAAARPELEAYAPQELAALRAELAQARVQLAAGHYTEALRLGQRLPGPIRDAVERAARRKAGLAAEWSKLAAVLPLEQRGIEARLDQLSSATPPLIDAAARGAARGELADLSAAWSRAEAAFASGQLPQALAAAHELQPRTDALAARLGISPAAAASAGAAPPRAPSPALAHPPARPPAKPPSTPLPTPTAQPTPPPPAPPPTPSPTPPP
ncbi:MAG: hypothetical protein ACM3PV_08610 [Betaproteobacteria bacterium]